MADQGIELSNGLAERVLCAARGQGDPAAYEAGRLAYEQGRSVATCPHGSWTQAGGVWCRGWFDAKEGHAERIRLAGALVDRGDF